MPTKARSSSDSTPADLSPPPVAIVVSRYNLSITDRLLDGAIAAYEDAGGDVESLIVLEAPGAYELTALSLAAAELTEVLGVVALGCVIKGETRHDRYLCDAVANGLTAITVSTGVPVAFGVLTVDTPRQARDRAGGKHGNKGREAMEALLATIATIERLANGEVRRPVLIKTKDKAAPRTKGKR